VERIVPIFRAEDASATARWYERLGFVKTGEHRFAIGLPLYVFLRRNDVEIHLSEHAGDATPDSLVYFWVDEIDAVAAEFDLTPQAQPWGREIEIRDPDGNRLRIAQSLDS
jgi:catechol 2,3-dioxygenase-like lactoylglutathione lyase family enzyme